MNTSEQASKTATIHALEKGLEKQKPFQMQIRQEFINEFCIIVESFEIDFPGITSRFRDFIQATVNNEYIDRKKINIAKSINKEVRAVKTQDPEIQKNLALISIDFNSFIDKLLSFAEQQSVDHEVEDKVCTAITVLANETKEHMQALMKDDFVRNYFIIHFRKQLLQSSNKNQYADNIQNYINGYAGTHQQNTILEVRDFPYFLSGLIDHLKQMKKDKSILESIANSLINFVQRIKEEIDYSPQLFKMKTEIIKIMTDTPVSEEITNLIQNASKIIYKLESIEQQAQTTPTQVFQADSFLEKFHRYQSETNNNSNLLNLEEAVWRIQKFPRFINSIIAILPKGKSPLRLSLITAMQDYSKITADVDWDKLQIQQAATRKKQLAAQNPVPLTGKLATIQALREKKKNIRTAKQ